MPHTYATLVCKRAPMYDPSVAAKVVEQLTNMGLADAAATLEQHIGRYVRGKHVGQLRGTAFITVCTVGGWLKAGPGYMNGGVILPGTVISINIADFMGKTLFSYGTR